MILKSSTVVNKWISRLTTWYPLGLSSPKNQFKPKVKQLTGLYNFSLPSFWLKKVFAIFWNVSFSRCISGRWRIWRRSSNIQSPLKEFEKRKKTQARLKNKLTGKVLVFYHLSFQTGK